MIVHYDSKRNCGYNHQRSNHFYVYPLEERIEKLFTINMGSLFLLGRIVLDRLPPKGFSDKNIIRNTSRSSIHKDKKNTSFASRYMRCTYETMPEKKLRVMCSFCYVHAAASEGGNRGRERGSRPAPTRENLIPYFVHMCRVIKTRSHYALNFHIY